jgi:D-alanyl-D-alanine carboxypeptidase
MGPAEAWTCQAIRFSELPLERVSASAAQDALRLAYADVEFSADGNRVRFQRSHWLEWGEVREVSPEQKLALPSIAEQFEQTYPLDFDLTRRSVPYFEPGRFRNPDFFSTLYARDEATVRTSIVTVREPRLSNASFQVTTRHNVSCQLATALAALADQEENFDRLFVQVGGGYNWRVISGTRRLSPHSFGIAIDLNSRLGGYWQWSGAKPGQVGEYKNLMPKSLVETMEAFGFIWGGKWHHYDGMHFEYRPELILHARMMEP